jgi:ferrochelatase
MTIGKLLLLTGGELINKTLIDEVNSATIYPKKIQKGDLFIGEDKEDIKEAIKNGAAAVMLEDDLTIDAQNVALIKVESIEIAALKILAYILHKDEDLHFYLLNPKALSFFKMIQLKAKDVDYLPHDWKKAFELILNSKKAIFVCDNEELAIKIFPKIKKFDKSAFGYNIEDTLFRSTFRVDKFVYQHKKMTPFHLEHLLKAIALCVEHKLDYSIDRVEYTKHFVPIFIDKETMIKKEEKNDHVVIVVDNVEDIFEGREYAKEAKVTMSKSIVFTPPKIKIEAYTKPNIFRSSVELVTIVKTTSFNYGFVYSKKREDLKALREYFRGLEKL